MPIIYTYPKATPKATDLLIGTVVEDNSAATVTKGNPTVSFPISKVQSLFNMNTTDTTVALTTTQIKEAYSNPITLLAAPGADSVLNIQQISIYVEGGTVAFDSGYDFELTGPWATANDITIDKSIINVTANTKTSWVGIPASNYVMQTNSALVLSVPTENISNGNGLVYVNIIYKTQELSSSF